MNSSARPTSVRKRSTACHSSSVTRWRSSTSWIAAMASGTIRPSRSFVPTASVVLTGSSSSRTSALPLRRSGVPLRVGIGVVEDLLLRDVGMHAGAPRLVAELAHRELHRFLDLPPRGAEVDADEPVRVLDHAPVDEHGVDVAALRLERDV